MGHRIVRHADRLQCSSKSGIMYASRMVMLPASAAFAAWTADTGVSVFRQREANTMEIQEFQAKALLARYAIACPHGVVAASSDEAEQAVRQIGADAAMVKAQVLAGDRARAGGIQVARSPERGRAAAAGL